VQLFSVAGAWLEELLDRREVWQRPTEILLSPIETHCVQRNQVQSTQPAHRVTLSQVRWIALSVTTQLSLGHLPTLLIFPLQHPALQHNLHPHPLENFNNPDRSRGVPMYQVHWMGSMNNKWNSVSLITNYYSF
jgi:hypothetical protein